MTRDVKLHRAAPARRRGAGAVGVLTSALTGGGLVFGHVAVGENTVHVEDLALQAFTAPTGSSAPETVPDLPASPTPASGAVQALAEPPPAVDVDAVIGAATTAADDAVAARRAAREAAATSTRPLSDSGAAQADGPNNCTGGNDGFGAVAASTATAGQQLRCMFGVDTVYGVAGRASTSDHPKGKALDFMVDQATGEKLAAYARQNMDELGISYVIYRQRIDTGSGWEGMEDRGGETANHMDHVHISFD